MLMKYKLKLKLMPNFERGIENPYLEVWAILNFCLEWPDKGDQGAGEQDDQEQEEVT